MHRKAADELRTELPHLLKLAKDWGLTGTAEGLQQAVDCLDEDIAEAKECAREADRETMLDLRRSA